MSSPTPTAYKTKNWPAYNKALKRHGSLSIRFDPLIIWEAESTENVAGSLTIAMPGSKHV